MIRYRRYQQSGGYYRVLGGRRGRGGGRGGGCASHHTLGMYGVFGKSNIVVQKKPIPCMGITQVFDNFATAPSGYVPGRHPSEEER